MQTSFLKNLEGVVKGDDLEKARVLVSMIARERNSGKSCKRVRDHAALAFLVATESELTLINNDDTLYGRVVKKCRLQN